MTKVSSWTEPECLVKAKADAAEKEAREAEAKAKAKAKEEEKAARAKAKDDEKAAAKAAKAAEKAQKEAARAAEKEARAAEKAARRARKENAKATAASEASAAAPAAASEQQQEPACSTASASAMVASDISAEDFSRFSRMAKAGVPLMGVAQKMTAEGFPQAAIDAVLATAPSAQQADSGNDLSSDGGGSDGGSDGGGDGGDNSAAAAYAAVGATVAALATPMVATPASNATVASTSALVATSGLTGPALVVRWLCDSLRIDEGAATVYADALAQAGYDDLDALTLDLPVSEAEGGGAAMIQERFGLKEGHARRLVRKCTEMRGGAAEPMTLSAAVAGGPLGGPLASPAQAASVAAPSTATEASDTALATALVVVSQSDSDGSGDSGGDDEEKEPEQPAVDAEGRQVPSAPPPPRAPTPPPPAFIAAPAFQGLKLGYVFGRDVAGAGRMAQGVGYYADELNAEKATDWGEALAEDQGGRPYWHNSRCVAHSFCLLVVRAVSHSLHCFPLPHGVCFLAAGCLISLSVDHTAPRR